MDFLIKELDLEFSLDELTDYYNRLEMSYQHLCWHEADNNVKDSAKHNIAGVYGWGIQSNLPSLSEPCPPYHVHKSGTNEYRDTPLMFGFAEKIKEAFPYSRQHSVAYHPPGTKINLHIDTDTYYKIHLPITGNDKSYFFFEDEQFVLNPGKAYLVNTEKMHGTNNLGTTSRVHLFFKIPVDKIPAALEVKKI